MLKKLLGAAAMTVLLAGPAQAVTPTTIDLFGEVFEGPFAGTTGSGFVTFDADFLDGETTLSPLDGLIELSFTLFGQTFTAGDDIDFDDFPTISFDENGVMIDINYVVSEVPFEDDLGQILTDIDEPGVLGFSFFGGLIDDDFPDENELPQLLAVTQNPLFSGVISIDTAVPLPATLPLLAGALLVGGAVARRRKR